MKTEPQTFILIKDLKAQFAEQLRCLDSKTEMDVSVLAEILDFYKRRALVEQDYADNLNKLAQTLKGKHVQQKAKRQSWPSYTTSTLWQTLVGSTLRVAHHHTLMADIFSKQMVQRIQDMQEDAHRLAESCKSVTLQCQEKVASNIKKLQADLAEYQRKQKFSCEAEEALKKEEAKLKKEMTKAQNQGKDPEKSKKVRTARTQHDEKSQIYQKARLATTVTRNEYIIQLAAVNACVHKFFRDEMSDILDCMACGFHNSLARAIMMHLSCEEAMKSLHGSIVDMLNKNVTEFDARKDKKLLVDNNTPAFAKPQEFKFEPFKEDTVNQICAQPSVRPTLESTLSDLKRNLESLKVKTEEEWKTLEAVEKFLMTLINQRDYDVSELFAQTDRNSVASQAENVSGVYSTVRGSCREKRVEQERFYLERFATYMEDMHRQHVMQAKVHAIMKSLGGEGGARPPDVPKKAARKVVRVPNVGEPKLFGGTVDEYVAATNQEIPLIVQSCIRVINMYGMHHQGIFRVSGSQSEITEFKTAFEQGMDPLERVSDARDINSTSGLLKLYFRELGEPLFPRSLFEEVVACSRLGDLDDCVHRLRDILGSMLSKPVYILMRYLFSFLHHLTEYSDENMMDPYNLAICFGPTLMPVPAELDQVQYQANVNEVVRTIIVRHADIFKNDVDGLVYEKYQYIRADDDDDDNTPDGDTSNTEPSLDRTSIDEEEFTPSESDASQVTATGFTRTGSLKSLQERCKKTEPLTALAHSDFIGQSPRELTFRLGDRLVLYRQLNPHWWEGRLEEGSKEGLIPDLYVRFESGARSASSSSNPFPASIGEGGTESSPSPPPPPDPSGLMLEEEEDSRDEPEGEEEEQGASKNATLDPVVIRPKLSSSSLNTPALHPVMEEGVAMGDVIDPAMETSVHSTTGLMETDIDNAIQDVMRGLASLEAQSNQSSRCTTIDRSAELELKMHLPSSKHTPDLVIDLPHSSRGPETSTFHPLPPAGFGSGTTAADTFAEQGQETMKKRPGMTRDRHDPVEEVDSVTEELEISQPPSSGTDDELSTSSNPGANGGPAPGANGGPTPLKKPPPVAPKPRRP